MPDFDKFAAVPVINVSDREQFLRSDLCLGSAVPGKCLNDGVQAKTPAQNVSFMANGQQSVDTSCETAMRDSSSRGVGRTASDGAARGVAAASARPVAHPTPAQGDMPVPSDQLCSQPRCAAVNSAVLTRKPDCVTICAVGLKGIYTLCLMPIFSMSNRFLIIFRPI